jgi:hypothetical protein
MPTLCIIPAAAVADPNVTDTHLRVLCAIGTHTNRLGGNVWASVGTLADESNLSERTVQRSITALVEAGYLRKTERTGRTNLYDVVLEGVTPVSPTPVTPVTPPPTELCHPNEKKNEKKNDSKSMARGVCNAIWDMYPKRDTPHLFPPAVRAIAGCIDDGAEPNRLISAAFLYAEEVRRKQVEPRYVKTIHKFYADGVWEHYTQIVLVHGRTREEWARSGQDVAEFDRLLAGDPNAA